MGNHAQLSPKPGGSSGGHLWTIWADWGLVAKVGLGFVGAIALFASVQFYFEEDNQKDSFAIALASIANVPIEQPVTQRRAWLLKTRSEYSWRAILWIRDGTELRTKIWQANVLHEGKLFRCVSSEISDYRVGKAQNLELFEDVSAGPHPPH